MLFLETVHKKNKLASESKNLHIKILIIYKYIYKG